MNCRPNRKQSQFREDGEIDGCRPLATYVRRSNRRDRVASLAMRWLDFDPSRELTLASLGNAGHDGDQVPNRLGG
jgi:hypothetical protein